MKRILAFALSFIVLCSIGYAEITYDSAVCINDVFQVSSIEEYSSDIILLAGKSNGAAQLRLVDMDGKTVWEYQDNDASSDTSYRSALQLNAQTIAALITNWNDDNCCIDFVQKQGRIFRSEPIKDARKLHNFKNGVLVDSHPDTYKTSLIQIDETGTRVWSIDFNEFLFFSAVIENNGVNYAYGYKIPDIDNMRGILMAFDDKGQVLWEYESTEETQYVDAIVYADRILAVGISSLHDSCGNLVSFDSNNVEWREPIPSTSTDIDSDVRFSSREITSIKVLHDGLLIATEGVGTNGAPINGAWLYKTDFRGQIIDKKPLYTESIAAEEKCRLLSLKDSVYIMLYGESSIDYDSCWWGDGYPTQADAQRSIYLQEVDSYF